MKNFRFRYETRGAHVHVRVFSGHAPHMTHAKLSDLVFGAEEWDQFVGCLRGSIAATSRYSRGPARAMPTRKPRSR